jgi:hypothetical protein
MKKALGILLFLLLASSVLAKGDGLPSPGPGPSSFLWGLDKALENINLLLTFDREERIRIGLEIAQERLAEANASHANPRYKKQALDGYALAVGRVQAQLAKYDDSSDNSKAFIEDVNARFTMQQRALASITNESIPGIVEATSRLQAEIEKHGGNVGLQTALEAVTKERPEQNETNETVEEHERATPSNASRSYEHRNVTIVATTKANLTDVVVVGDINRTFTVNSAALGAITANVANELSMDPADVESILVLKVQPPAPKINVMIEGEEIARVTITGSMEKKITLSITDPDAILKEVAKRTGLDYEMVKEVTTFGEENNLYVDNSTNSTD